MDEEWRPVPGFEGRYDVSDAGRVRNATTLRVLKPLLKQRGYLSVDLCVIGARPRTLRVHRLVALAFLAPRPGAEQVNHKDGCKTNNAAGNLEFVTGSENLIHALRTGLLKPVFGYCHPNTRAMLAKGQKRSLSPEDTEAIRREYSPGENGSTKIGRKFGVSPVTVLRVVRGEYDGIASEHANERRRTSRDQFRPRTVPVTCVSGPYRMAGEPNREVSCACGCGTSFLLYDALGRPRRFSVGHNTRGMKKPVGPERRGA